MKFLFCYLEELSIKSILSFCWKVLHVWGHLCHDSHGVQAYIHALFKDLFVVVLQVFE